MLNKKNAQYLQLFGYFLMLFSFTFIIYGFILQYNDMRKEKLHPVKEMNNDSTIHIDKPVINKNNEDNYISNINYSIIDLEKENNLFRNRIQEQYGIQIMYGKETEGYSINRVHTNSLNDINKIYESLFRLLKCLEKYPIGMFQEIKEGGIPLTIILVDSYSDSNITGVTDSSSSYAKISLAVSYPLEESFYHYRLRRLFLSF